MEYKTIRQQVSEAVLRTLAERRMTRRDFIRDCLPGTPYRSLIYALEPKKELTIQDRILKSLGLKVVVVPVDTKEEGA